ncbi:MAG TPA: M48 family metallopeptidase [Pyrinomonadaceae bacterium]|nr:M48 family metallopeptidase [Pyrinomonadaceae bacterium]
MKQEEFDALVKRLEGYARAHPASYKLRVGLLAALGYGYILLVLAVLVALFVAVVSTARFGLELRIALILMVFAGVILRSLWVKLPAPQGLELRREDAPLLFEMVLEASRALEAPRPDHVLLTDDFNAAVVQRPRLGLLGWQVNYLVVGLPLMQALSPAQFRAVVAHEFGHLSGNHGRFAGWIYRVRQTWVQILLRLRREGRRADIFEVFLKWYAPYFNAYSFVLGRAQEYEADRSAADLAGKEHAAEALINLEVKGRFLEQRFWRDIFKDADGQAEPPPTAFAQMAGALRGAVAPSDARQWVWQALMTETGTEDTHPALKDRLAALGYWSTEGDGEAEVRLPGANETSAAEHFLPGAAERFAAQLGPAWRQKAALLWQERFAYLQEAREKLRELKERAEKQPLTPEETLTYAVLIAELKGGDVAIPLLRKILDTRPDDATVNYLLGRLLLEREDEAGVAHIERAMEMEPDSVPAGCESIYWFLVKQERGEEAEAYRERAIRHWKMLERAREERKGVSAEDRFLPHGLPPAALAHLRAQLSRFNDVEAAYLVRKELSAMASRPLYVLGIERRARWFEPAKTSKNSELEMRLLKGVDLPGDLHLFILGKDNGWLADVFRQTEGAEIYRRDG